MIPAKTPGNNPRGGEPFNPFAGEMRRLCEDPAPPPGRMIPTPGPWACEGYQIVSAAPGLFEVGADGGIGAVPIATLCLGLRSPTHGYTGCNALLLAAAPELLAACKSAACWFGELGNDDGAQGLLDDLRAVIAKAEGRSNG